MFSPSMTSSNLVFSMLVPLLLFQVPSVINGDVHIITADDTSLNCLYEKDAVVKDPLAVINVSNPPPILAPTVVPPLVPAATIIQPAVDPVNPVTTITTTDPVLLSSPETQHQSTLSPMRPSPLDLRTS